MTDLLVLSAEGLTDPLVLLGVTLEGDCLIANSVIARANISDGMVLQGCVLRAGIFELDPQGVRVITLNDFEALNHLADLPEVFDSVFKPYKFRILKEGVNE